ncbi:MAG: class I SAM-dependent methyltransferase [Kovacikia sp.]
MSLLESLKPTAKSILLPPYCRLRYGKLGGYFAQARLIPSWTTPKELLALAQVCQSLPDDAVIVEIGSFLGRAALFMGGTRKLIGSGKVHCVDPFDGSGEDHSIPVFRRIASQSKKSLRERFDDNMRRGGVEDWVEVHQGTAESIAKGWSTPIDLLYMDADQSPEGVRSAYSRWIPFLKPGGIIAAHNSANRSYVEGDNDGHLRLVKESFQAPDYIDIYCVDSTTFARKVIDQSAYRSSVSLVAEG